MRACYIRAEDGRVTVETRELAQPEPGPGQVRVRVRAAGLNRGELLSATATPKAAGLEAAGEVSKLGAGVTQFRLGDRVMGRCPGAFAEYGLMDARETLPVPPILSWEQAGAVPIAFLVVYDMLLEQGRLRPGEWLLVTGVASGVGVAALQVAKALGAGVIGSSGSAQKLELLKPLGLDVALLTRAGDFSPAVVEATGGKGANLCVNNVGGSVFAECVRALAFEGRLAAVGHMDETPTAPIDLEALHAKRLTLFGVSNRLRDAAQRSATVRGFAERVLPMLGDGRITPHIDRVYAFDELGAAMARMQSNSHVGKIIVRI